MTRKLEGGVTFTGQLDKLEPLGKIGEVMVVDYKTGEPDKHVKALQNCQDISSAECDDYLRQLVGYKLLYERGHRSLRANAGQLVFIDPVKSSVKKYGLTEGEFISTRIPLTQEMAQQYEGMLKDIWKQIRRLEFTRLEKYDDKKCKYCPYQGVCWKK